MAERTDPTKRTNHPFYCQYRAVYEHVVQFVQAQRVLDVGCGEGYGAYLLAQHAKEVIAIDRHKKTIQQARRRYALPNLSFQIQDVSGISAYSPCSFDVVCCFHVIEHLKATENFLIEVGKRLSDPLGILLISTPNRHSPFRRATGFQWPYHEREYTADEFRELLFTGFKDVTLYTLQASPKVHQFQNIRAQHIQQIFRWDILKLRQWLPQRCLQVSFDIGGKLLKSFIGATHRELMYGITIADFYVTGHNPLNEGLDLIGVCQTPRRAFEEKSPFCFGNGGTQLA